MYYYEHCLQPFMRNGLMVPRSALPDLFKLPDSGYCTVYGFEQSAKWAVRAQGDATGLGRFPVYSDRLWIDIDATNDTPQELERVKQYTRDLTRQFQTLDYNFTVWDSGSKGFHIAIKIEPMFGKDVPWSQLQYIQSAGITCDYSLYQHGRLLSNPGRVHPKTGRKKSKVFEHAGNTTLSIPMLKSPDKPELDLNTLTDSDLARIALNRLNSLIQDAPMPGMRHTTFWSTASQCLEAGLKSDLVYGLLSWANKFSPTPKDDSEIKRAVEQAAAQLGMT